MNKLLVVEDSPIVVKIIKHLIRDETEFHCDVAMSRKQAEALIDSHESNPYLAAIVDLHLPDAPDGEVVDITLAKHIPTLVLTGTVDDRIREQMQKKPIVDYIVKESRFSYEMTIKQIQRLKKNQHLKVMVVDDSSTSRKYTRSLLQQQLLNVVEAVDGVDALEKLTENPETILLIVDYNMPRMDGIELVRNIRKDPAKNDLIIIGISTQNESALSARFIKNGANDFLTKPFSHEEFNCRIAHNIDSYEQIQKIKKMAYSDFLTGIPNRRYFYENGRTALESARQKGTPICLVLIDLDNFKKINDQFGHDAGDAVLIDFAQALEQAMGRFLFARTGGEEFAVLLSGMDLHKAVTWLENFREITEDRILVLSESSLTTTFSAGITQFTQGSLEELMKVADEQLYLAKSGGKNQICYGNF